MCPQDLFSTEPDAAPAPDPHAPLAERLRPRTLADVVGQSHLLGPGKPLRLAFDSGKLHSMILWGPPGVGKTTLARLTAQAFGADFIAISAVLSGVKDIREAVERARMNQKIGRATILFVDEVHRFNKYIKVVVNQQLKNIFCAIFVPWHNFQARSSMILGQVQHG
ncbi:AAA family ATPase [Thiobacillus sp.]